MSTRSSPARLIFVYNAGSSVAARIAGLVHKTIAPETYPCSLCRVTYGVLKAKKEWAKFIADLPCSSLFLHRDEFKRRFPSLAPTALPAIFWETEAGAMRLLIAQEDLKRMRGVEQLIALLSAKLISPIDTRAQVTDGGKSISS